MGRKQKKKIKNGEKTKSSLGVGTPKRWTVLQSVTAWWLRVGAVW